MEHESGHRHVGLRGRRQGARPTEGAPGRPQGAGGSARAAGRCAAPARPPDRIPAPDPGCVRIHLRRAHRRAGAGDVARDDRGLRGRDVLSSLRRREGRRNAAAAADGARLRDAVLPDGGIGGAARRGRGRLRARRARHRRAVHRPLRARARRRRRPQSDRSRDRRKPIMAAIAGKQTEPDAPRTSTTRRIARPAATAPTSRACSGERPVDDVVKTMEDSSLRGLGGAGFPVGRKWKIVRAEPAPRLMAVNIDEGEPGTFKDRYYLERDPHRFLEGMLIAAWAVGIDDIYVYLRDEYAACRAILAREIAALEADPPCSVAAHPPAPRRGRLHLRRRVGDDRVDRRQARHAAAASAVRRAGRALRPADARAQHGDALLGARHPREGRAVVRRPRPARPQGAALVLGVGPRREARRASRARRHHRARADRRVLRRHAARPRVLRLSSRRRVGRDPAGVARRRSARFRYAAAARLVHRLGGGHRAVAARPRARRGAQPDALLRRRIVRPMHAVPRRHRKGGRPDRARRPGTCRCSTSCRGRWPMRRSAGWGRRRPIRSPASSAISRRN